MIKYPERGGAFSWHQDSGYVSYSHRPYLTVWCAIDAASEENGTIYVLSYSRAGTRERVEHVIRPGLNDKVGYFGDDPGIPVRLPAGGVAVFSSTMFHRSGPNRSSAMRRAFISQYVAEPLYTEDGSAVRWFADPILKNGRYVGAR